MSIVFTKTRYHYEPYADLFRLAALAGFRVATIDDIDPDSDDTYILSPMNGEVQELMPKWRTPADRRATIIWWFLERFDTTPMLTDGSYERFRPHFDKVWISDRWMAAQHPTLQHIILGSHAEFGGDCLPIEYDYTHQSYVSARRAPVYKRLHDLGLREAPSGWGDARDDALRKSATMVHVQQCDLPLYTPLRFAIAAAYALPLVCEQLHDPYPLSPEELIQVPLTQLPEKVREIANNPSTFGERLYEALCLKHSFRTEVENAL